MGPRVALWKKSTVPLLACAQQHKGPLPSPLCVAPSSLFKTFSVNPSFVTLEPVSSKHHSFAARSPDLAQQHTRSLNTTVDQSHTTPRPHDNSNYALLNIVRRSSAACPCSFSPCCWVCPHQQPVQLPRLLRVSRPKRAREHGSPWWQLL